MARLSKRGLDKVIRQTRASERRYLNDPPKFRTVPRTIARAGSTIFVAKLTEDLEPATSFLEGPTTATAQPVKKNDGDVWYVDNDEDAELEITNRDVTLSVPENSYVWYVDVMGENHVIYVGCVETNEVQRITLIGLPTGGTFKLRFESEYTSPIPYNATATQIKNALEALAAIGAGDILATGGPFPGADIEIEFSNSLANTNVPLLGYDITALTGGTSPQMFVEQLEIGCCREI